MSLKTLNLMSDKSAPYLMKKLPRLYSLFPWRERVRVRGINLHAILDTILMLDRKDSLGYK
jgi:hypothetical protein